MRLCLWFFPTTLQLLVSASVLELLVNLIAATAMLTSLWGRDGGVRMPHLGVRGGGKYGYLPNKEVHVFPLYLVIDHIWRALSMACLHAVYIRNMSLLAFCFLVLGEMARELCDSLALYYGTTIAIFCIPLKLLGSPVEGLRIRTKMLIPIIIGVFSLAVTSHPTLVTTFYDTSHDGATDMCHAQVSNQVKIFVYYPLKAAGKSFYSQAQQKLDGESTQGKGGCN